MELTQRQKAHLNRLTNKCLRLASVIKGFEADNRYWSRPKIILCEIKHTVNGLYKQLHKFNNQGLLTEKQVAVINKALAVAIKA